MPAPPYFNALPLDGNSRRYVDQSAWDSVIGAFYAWPDHVNANQKNLSNLGVASFAAGGYIAGGSAVGAFTDAANNVLSVRSATGYDSALSLFEASSGYGFTLRNVHNAGLSIIRHHGDPTGVSALYIERATGNVGIGTASPNFLMDIARDNVAIAGTPFGDWQGNGTLALSTVTDRNRRLVLGYSYPDDVSVIQSMHSSVGTRPLLLNPHGGNIGIGMAPSYQLQLSTDSAAKPTSNTWTVPSDLRLKRNITPFTDGLAVLRQLNPISYELNGLAGTPEGAKGISIIAQEARPVAPYMIGSRMGKLRPDDTEDTEILDFNASAMPFLLRNGVVELADAITEIKARLDRAGL